VRVSSSDVGLGQGREATAEITVPSWTSRAMTPSAMTTLECCIE
jgi:hypothetical protein